MDHKLLGDLLSQKVPFLFVRFAMLFLLLFFTIFAIILILLLLQIDNDNSTENTTPTPWRIEEFLRFVRVVGSHGGGDNTSDNDVVIMIMLKVECSCHKNNV